MTILLPMPRAGRLAFAPALALALALAGAPGAQAQVGVLFNRTGSGARAAGMANAFIAVSDDGTAASWNPSGLAQLRKPELSVVSTTIGDSISAAGFRSRDDSSTFSNASSAYSKTYLDFASLAVPATLWGKSVTFQAAWRRLYELDYREIVTVTREPLTEDAPPALRLDGNADTLGSVDSTSVAAAVRLTSRLSLGASYQFWRGDWTENQYASETSLDPPGASRFGSVTQTNRLRGQNLTLGLMLAYPRFSIGMLYQSPLRSDYSNSVTVRLSDEPEATSEPIDGTLWFPRAVGIGGAFRPAARWTLALDLTWEDWSEALLDTPQTGRVNLFDSLPPDSTATRDTLSLNAGAERLFTGDGFVVPLRFGVAWEPQGARDPYTRDPVSYVMLALGTGYNTNSLKLDAAFQYRWASFTTGADFGLAEAMPLLPSAVGERSINQWRLKLSLIFRMTDTDKLKRTLHKVFG
jgi:long-chain fatty acid transport protein